jgi:exopolysaccharide biosynthesis polyprenyl glycosylphosphotransferase
LSEGVLAYPDGLERRSRWVSIKGALLAGGREAARAAVIATPIAAAASWSGVSAGTLFEIVIATAIWFVALRTSYSGPGPSALVLGTSIVTALGTISGLAAVSMLSFWMPGLEWSWRQLLLMTGGVFLLTWAFESALRRPASRRRLVLVGADDGTKELLAELGRHPELPFELVGIVDDHTSETIAGARRLGRTRELGTILRDESPDLVVLGSEAYRADALSHVLDLASLDVRVVDVHHFNEHAFGKVPVHHLSPVWFMGVLHLYQRPYSRIVKRGFDVLAAGTALLLAAPLLLVVALILRASSSGPVFFRQLRLGEGGRLFQICKFRTMVEHAEGDGVAVWALEDDARVTPIGRVLRRSRLDELPQLWNVLRGDMSIVGPRPERPEFLELLRETVPFWTRRHLVKPGITGWAQVRRGYTADVMGTADKLSYDLYYLKYRSLVFDLAIATQTFRIVLSGFGSR